MDQQTGASGVATTAKDQAGQVGQTAAQAGGEVAQTTKEQARNVVGETKQQARDLVWEARGQVREQAGTQKGRAVGGLRTLADELDQMAQQGGQSGIATEVARQAAQRAHGLADHLDRHEPAELLDQVRSYARRRPVAFLTGAAVLGVLAGRMTRNLASGDDSGPRRLTGTNAYPAGYGTTGYPVGAESTGGYEPGYTTGVLPSDQPGGGFRPVGEPGYEPGPAYPAGTGYGTGTGTGTGYGTETGYAAGTEAGYGAGSGTEVDPAYGSGADGGLAGGPAQGGYAGGPEGAPGTQESPGYEGDDDPAWRTR